MKLRSLLLGALGLAGALACYSASPEALPPADPPMGATDLPCDVAAVVARNCASCHGAAPKNGAPMALVTVAAFQSANTDTTKPGATIGDRSVARAKDAKDPMPPFGAMSASEIATLETWVQAGMPKGSCASPPVNVTCTSGTSGTRREGPTMRPGDTCIHCHASEGEGPTFEAAGTVYPTLREPTPCAAPAAAVAGVSVELTDANGRVYSLPVNSAGNFYLEDSSFTPPYSARVLGPGGVKRAMKARQTSGECNGCHAEPPAGGAPGRVLLP